MKNIFRMLFCTHRYKFDRIDSDHPTKPEYKIAHKSCISCGREKNVLIKK